MDVNGGGVPIQRGKVDSSHKYVAFLVFNATWGAGFLGNSLKLRCSVGIIGLELCGSVSGKVSKRAEMPFMKLNGKSRLVVHSL
jgi:hypothetical protein